MPGKSNKFDFTHRSSSGVKLGQSIAETFRKEVDKAKKDAERQAAKLRKRNSDGIAAAPDNGKDIGIHIIDFKAPSKNLGDDGVLAMAPAVAQAIEAGSCDAYLCLEDINLSGNGLTVASLAALAPVVEAARFDLKTINLTNNDISVITIDDAVAWEKFLRAFSSCHKLRRIDLSKNNKLGTKAFEVFARCYQSERPITPLQLAGSVSVRSLNDSFDQKENALTPQERFLTDGCLLARRCGLRSTPYLDFSDTGLDDGGALWLSTILAQHYFPEQLIHSPNAAPATTTIGIYQHEQNSTGIEWGGNEHTLGRDGLQLLYKVEDGRRKALLDSMSIASSTDLIDNMDRLDPFTHDQLLLIPPTSNGRLTDSSLARHIDDGDSGSASLTSIRRRIQRQIIQKQGLHSVALWHSAVVMVSLSRRLFILARSFKRVICRYNKAPPSLVENTPYTDQNAVLSPRWCLGAPSELCLDKERPSSMTYRDWQARRNHCQREALVLPWLLPFEVFDNIIRHIMPANEVMVMNSNQRRAVHVFGQQSETLMMGREWQKMNESVQIWKLLDSVLCLTYEASDESE